MDMINRNNITRFIGNNNNMDHNDNNPTVSSCSTENGSESPPSNNTNSSSLFNEFSKISHNHLIPTTTSSSISSTKKSGGSGRRSVQKRVVSIPIKEVEGSTSRLKGGEVSCHISTPPSDSWAWRKYGQKPIKGSPYPRGYYRCSSSKGCPARKQVERSRVDPTMLLVTYSAEHNHPWPPSSSRNNKHHSTISPNVAATIMPTPNPSVKDEELALEEEHDLEPEVVEERFVEEAATVMVGLDDEFGWFGAHMEATLESPIFADGSGGACDSLAAVFPMGEEDESLFADLEELPECSLVFRHRGVGPQVEIC